MVFNKDSGDILKQFRESLPGLSDETLKNILKKRTYYNPEAAHLAIREAIARGIISSEQELENDPGYRVEPMKSSLFPPIDNVARRNKTIKSLSRGMLLAGLIPVIFGITEITENRVVLALPALVFGGIWLVVSFLMYKRPALRLTFVLLVMSFFALIYLIFYGFDISRLKLMDYFAAVIVFILIYYSLFYLRKLLKQTL